VLGKTGERVPILGLGTACGGMGLSDSDAVDLYDRAIDLGVTYLDTATGYARAQKQLSEILPSRRDEVFLVTKAYTADRKEAISILEQNLKDMKTDAVDLAFVHSVGSLDVEQVLSADGALAGMREARDRGLTRFIGFTAHNVTWKSVKVLQEAELDVVMLAMNYVDRHTYGFEDKALPVAREKNVGVAAMKVFGGAPKMTYDKVTASQMELHPTAGHEVDLSSAFRYALSLPGVATAVVGMYSIAELEENVDRARAFVPLTEAEEAALTASGQPMAQDWGAHFGEAE
jgi:hypothetical protein